MHSIRFSKGMIVTVVIVTMGLILLSAVAMSGKAEEQEIQFGYLCNDLGEKISDQQLVWEVLATSDDGGFITISREILGEAPFNTYASTRIPRIFFTQEGYMKNYSISFGIPSGDDVKKYLLGRCPVQKNPNTTHVQVYDNGCGEWWVYPGPSYEYKNGRYYDYWVNHEGKLCVQTPSSNTFYRGVRPMMYCTYVPPAMGIRLRDEATNNYVGTLKRAYGSLSWDRAYGSFNWDGHNKDDYSSLILEVNKDDRNDKIMSTTAIVTLPDGFSFMPNSIVKQKTITLKRNEETLHGETKVYPIYCDKGEELVFKANSGDSECEEIVSIRDVDAGERGHIYMRPTRKVSKNTGSFDYWMGDSFQPTKFVTWNPEVYSDDLSMLGCVLSQAVYNKDMKETDDDTYIMNSLHNLGFFDVDFRNNKDPYGAAAAIARKKVIVDNKVYNICMVVVRGTVDFEWIGNFDVIGEDEQVHNNFHDCYEDVYKMFKKYLDECRKHEEGFAFDRFYVCGHSRGGAIANLFANDLNVNFGNEKVMCYTFAAPNCTKNPSECGNIFNYCYAFDFVPFVPQRYGKNGVTLVVGDKHAWLAAPIGVQEAFYEYTGHNNYFGNPVGLPFLRDVIVYNGGMSNRTITSLNDILGNMIADPNSVQDNFIARAHGAENYCAWVKRNGKTGAVSMKKCIANIISEKYKINFFSGKPTISARIANLEDAVAQFLGRVHTEKEESDTALWIKLHLDWNEIKDEPFSEDWSDWIPKIPIKYKGVNFIFKCPVDIFVLDASKSVVAEVRNHYVRNCSDDIEVWGTGEMTFVSIPYGMSYQIEIHGTDAGEMNVSYFATEDFSSFEDVQCFEAIPVEAGEMFYTGLLIAGDNQALSLISSNGQTYGISDTQDMTKLYIPYGMKSIESETFEGIAAEMVIIPRECETIGSRAFAACPNLKYVVFKNPETQFAEDAFADNRDDLIFIGR